MLTTYPLIPGILVKARPVAYIDMIDSGESDAKVVCVPVNDPRFKSVNELKDINPHTLEEIKHFFLTYKMLQKKSVEISGIYDKESTLKVINESIEMFKNQNN
jgi:inorganic pyrophosphatase